MRDNCKLTLHQAASICNGRSALFWLTLIQIKRAASKKSVAFLERSASIGTGHLNAMAVRDNRQSSCPAPSALGEMRAVANLEKVQKSLLPKSLDFDG